MLDGPRGEYKLLKVWECHKCKTLIRLGIDVSRHTCNINENELTLSNKVVEEQKSLIEEQKSIIEGQKIKIGNINDLIEEHKKTIESQNKSIEYYKKTIESQKFIIGKNNKFIKEKLEDDQYKVIEDQKNIIERYIKTIESQKRSIQERDITIDKQNGIIENQKKIIRDNDLEEKTIKKEIPKIVDKNNGKICVHILKEGRQIRDSKDVGYRENIEIDIFEKGKGKDRIIIKNGKLTKKPADIDIIGEYTSEGFIMKGIYKN